MQFSTFLLIKIASFAAATLLLTACGGGDDDAKDAAYKSTTSTTLSPTALQISSGKLLYAASCAGCHGANMATAKDSTRTLGAIASNKGGMGYLSNTIQASQSDDIAAYLAFGI